MEDRHESDSLVRRRFLVRSIQQNLSPDLLKPQFRNASHPHHGHCYVASEALWHLLGDRESGWKPTRAKDASGIVHWWLGKDGQILDPTADQYYSLGLEPPYSAGRATSFLTVRPSKRARLLLSRIIL